MFLRGGSFVHLGLSGRTNPSLGFLEWKGQPNPEWQLHSSSKSPWAESFIREASWRMSPGKLLKLQGQRYRQGKSTVQGVNQGVLPEGLQVAVDQRLSYAARL